MAARAGAEDDVGACEVLGYGDDAFLEAVSRSLEREGTVVVNPHTVGSVSYVAWVAARLGGWKGYASQGLPGSETMARGLARLTAYRQAYLLGEDSG